MRLKKITLANFVLFFLVAIYFISCSKESTSPYSTPTPTTDPCSGKTIVITATPITATACGTNGSITVSATGSSGFTFKLNSGGTYQSSGVFGNVSAGTYTVFAKDDAGCEKSSVVTVAASGSAGPLFTAVKNLMDVKCVNCHSNAIQNGGMNWTVDCNIVQFQSRIKVRAVDEGTMPQGGPQLTASEKSIITNWINAGGKFTD